MHEKSYRYFTDIFPDTSKEYDGSSKVLSGTTEPVTEPVTEPATQPVTDPPTSQVEQTNGNYVIKSKTCYFNAEDTDVIDPNDLVESITQSFATYGNFTFTFDVDPDDLTLAEGWETPADILKNQAAGKSYFHMLTEIL